MDLEQTWKSGALYNRQPLQATTKTDGNSLWIGGDEMTYDEHLAFLIMQERGARAERQGFLDAKSFPSWTKPVNFTKDEREQQRYNLGWENGKTMLKCADAQEVR